MRRRHKLFYEVSSSLPIYYYGKDKKWITAEEMRGKSPCPVITNKRCKTFRSALHNARRIAAIVNNDYEKGDIYILRYFYKNGKRFQQEFWL